MNLPPSKEFPKFYGRRKGRKLSRLSILALKEGAGNIIEFENLSEIFSNQKQKIILEIGFGNGENLVNSAKINPDIMYLGADPFINTNAKCMKKILKYNLTNIKIWPDDIRKIINLLPQKSISKIKLLFPDPWPKLRHQNRRLIQTDFINNIHKILKTKGTITIGTDHKILKSWILEKFQDSKKF